MQSPWRWEGPEDEKHALRTCRHYVKNHRSDDGATWWAWKLASLFVALAILFTLAYVFPSL